MNLYADLTQLEVIREFVAQTIHELDLDEQMIPDLQLAVEEICANTLRHGYNGRSGKLEITIQSITDGVQVTVRDWGNTFDPDAVPLPDVDAPLEQRPLGGLGLFLVKQLMDEVTFEFDGAKGDSVKMIKRVRSRGAGS
jgi:serine/threonine-protein kinase RsbW